MALTQIKSGAIADDAIDSSTFADGSIDNAHLAANSVDSDQYVDGSIDNAHLADDAVDGDKLANNIDVAGTLDVTGAAVFDSTGTFTGNIKGGSAVYANTDGSRIDTQAVFIGYPSGGDSGASTTAILGNGSATFAGSVTVGSTSTQYNHIKVNRSDSGYIFEGGQTSTYTSRIFADGSAEFAGVIKADAGIDFSGAQTNLAGMTSETLDAYEEGTFTPTLGKRTGTPIVTYTEQSGKYTKIGNIVHVQLSVAVAAGITWTGTSEALTVEGLPFNFGHRNFRVATPGYFYYFNSSTLYYPTDFGWQSYDNFLFANTSSTGNSWTTTFDGATSTKLSFTYSTTSL